LNENGIRDLDRDTRRAVAASVFHALEKAQEDAKTANYRPADFSSPLLDMNEQAVALGLITSTVERVGPNNTFQLVKSAKYATTVTPAIAIVLFTMAGVRVSLKRDWKAEEEVAALYAVRRMMINVLHRFSRRDVAVMKNRKHTEGLKRDLLDELKTVNLYGLSKRIEAPMRREDSEPLKYTVRVPLVNRRSILVNGTAASFANVMAPCMLMQSKDALSGGRVDVNIKEELGKCCLLKLCKDDRPLRGLLAVWRGAFDRSGDRVPRQPATDSGEAYFEQDSDSFPENLVKYREPIEFIQYGSIEGASEVIKMGVDSVGLPQFDPHEKITYVIVTNARAVVIKLDNDCSLEVKQDMLTADKTLAVNNVSGGTAVQKWNKLMEELREGVTIQFLFTPSG
jgi:hypothetical protein